MTKEIVILHVLFNCFVVLLCCIVLVFFNYCFKTFKNCACQANCSVVFKECLLPFLIRKNGKVVELSWGSGEYYHEGLC